MEPRGDHSDGAVMVCMVFFLAIPRNLDPASSFQVQEQEKSKSLLYLGLGPPLSRSLIGRKHLPKFKEVFYVLFFQSLCNPELK